ITTPARGVDSREQVSNVLDNLDLVEGFSPFIYGKGLLQKGNSSHGVVIKGVEVEDDFLQLDKEVWAEMDEESLVLGNELKNILGLKKGDEVFLIIPTLDSPGSPAIPRVEKFILKEVFTSGIHEYDSSIAFINYERAGAIFKNPDASGVEVFINDPFKSQEVKSMLSDKLRGYNINTWKERNYNLFAALRLEKTMMFIVLIMIVIVATFNIAGTLIMTSITRSRDCGIMRAIGASKKNIRMMFNFKGLMIGFTGTVAGIALGLLISFFLSRYEFIQLPPQVYLISTLPVRVTIKDLGLIFSSAMLISFIATLYPSKRASDIEIAEEIKYE
ncbi:MAG: FtsX-like permease family protein, partial [Elusimicrobiota bacterium]